MHAIIGIINVIFLTRTPTTHTQHSCQPSCLLRYDIMRGRAVSLKVIALGSGGGGGQQQQQLGARVELTHSYVDLAQPTSSRQDTLCRTYGFQCTCSRCGGSSSAPASYSAHLCEALASSGSIEEELKQAAAVSAVADKRMRGKQQSLGTFALGGEGWGTGGKKLVWLEVEKAITAARITEGGGGGVGGRGGSSAMSSVAGAMREAAEWQRQAAVEGREGGGGREEAEAEARCLQRAATALRGAVGPFHFELYKVGREDGE